MERDQRRLAAIVAADVVGYSRLMGYDESGTLAALKSHRAALIDPKIAEYGGRIVKTVGDGLLMDFPSVVDAVRCAVDIQRGMRERNAGVPADRRIELRIGINVGDIIIDGEDIFGDGVNVAARLEGLAEPGGICVHRVVRDQVLDKLSFTFQDLGLQQVKNIARPLEVYRILDDMPQTPRTPSPVPRQTMASRRGRPLHWVAGAAIGAALLTAGGWQWSKLRQIDAPADARAFRSFVVLPPQGDDPPLAQRVHQELNAAVHAVDDASIASNAIARQYKGGAHDPRKIGRELNVRYVMESSLRKVDGGSELEVQVVDALDGAQVWSERQSIASTADLAESLAMMKRGLRLAMAKTTRKEVGSLPPGQRAAWDLVSRARSLGDSPEDLRKAQDIYEETLRAHPDFLPALVGLGDVLWGRLEMEPEHRETLAKRFDEVTLRQTQVAPRDGRSWIYRAGALRLQGNFNGALAAITEAVRIDPTRGVSLLNQADLLTHAGRASEALPLIEKAVRLDPGLSPTMARCHAYLMLARYLEAVEQCEAGAALQPDWRLYMYATAAHAASGDLEKARSWKARMAEAYPRVSLSRLRQTRFTDVPEGVAQMERWLAALARAGVPD